MVSRSGLRHQVGGLLAAPHPDSHEGDEGADVAGCCVFSRQSI